MGAALREGGGVDVTRDGNWAPRLSFCSIVSSLPVRQCNRETGSNQVSSVFAAGRVWVGHPLQRVRLALRMCDRVEIRFRRRDEVGGEQTTRSPGSRVPGCVCRAGIGRGKVVVMVVLFGLRRVWVVGTGGS